MRRRILAVGLLAFFALPAKSEFYDNTPELCFGHLMSATIVGDFGLNVGPLLLMVNNQPMMPDPAGSGTVTLRTDAEPLTEFVLTGLPSPMPDVALNQVTADATRDWTLSRAPGFELNNADLELVWACALSDLPALMGRFRTTSQDGYEIDNTIRLLVMNDNWLLGLWEFEAVGTPYPTSGIRSIELDRPVSN